MGAFYSFFGGSMYLATNLKGWVTHLLGHVKVGFKPKARFEFSRIIAETGACA